MNPFTKILSIYTFSASSVPHLRVPRNPKNWFCSLKMLNHPYYLRPSVISSYFEIPSYDSFTENLLKSFLFNIFISGLVAEKAAN